MKNKLEQIVKDTVKVVTPGLAVAAIVTLGLLPQIITEERKTRAKDMARYEEQVLKPHREMYNYLLTKGIIHPEDQVSTSNIIKYMELKF